MTTISLFLFFNKIIDISIIGSFIYSNNFTFAMYKIICACIIIIFICFLSKILEESETFNKIGRNSMNFMGLEYITNGYVTLTILPMINLGIPNINSTIGVFTIVGLSLIMNMWISDKIIKYMPVLSGQRH